MDDRRHDAGRCPIAPHRVSDQSSGFPFLSLQQLTKKSFSCTLITTGLDENGTNLVLIKTSKMILGYLRGTCRRPQRV